MRSFKQYITEIGDSSYPFHFMGSDDDGEYHHYHISHPTDPNKDTSVIITHEYPATEGKHEAEVSFRRANNPGILGFHKTGDMSTAESAKLFSTVHKIMQHHAVNNPNVSHFIFTSDKSEPTRGKLYDRFAKKVGGEIDRKYEGEPRGYTEYRIPADKL